MPSSVIAHIRYDELNHELYIRFVSGDLYKYKKVPVDVYDRLMKATSKGTFLNKLIKKNYDYQKIESDKPLSRR